MKAFSPLSEFETSDVLAAEWEKVLHTTVGQQLIAALREYALGLGGSQSGTVQDGARAVVDKMLDLTMSRRNERVKAGNAKPVISRLVARDSKPNPPASRYPKPEEPLI